MFCQAYGLQPGGLHKNDENHENDARGMCHKEHCAHSYQPPAIVGVNLRTLESGGCGTSGSGVYYTEDHSGADRQSGCGNRDRQEIATK